MAPKIETIGERLLLGEGPHWDESTNSLYFVDVFDVTLNRYVPSTKKHYKAKIESLPSTTPSTISFIIPVEGAGDKFVVSYMCKVLLVTWDGISTKVSDVQQLLEIENPEGYLQVNDAKADPTGRLWFGTLSADKSGQQWKWITGTSAVYTFQNGVVKKQLENVTLSNGLDWNREEKKFYFADSADRKVYQFDFDENVGSIANKTTIFDLDALNIPGIPDGLTIDTEGNLWVAIFDGSRVIKIDPRKPNTLLQTIELPAQQTTSLAFGGAALDELYVTTGNIAFPEQPKGEGSGFVHVIKGLGVKGLKPKNVKL